MKEFKDDLKADGGIREDNSPDRNQSGNIIKKNNNIRAKKEKYDSKKPLKRYKETRWS
jgi:hypothetical protein